MSDIKTIKRLLSEVNYTFFGWTGEIKSNQKLFYILCDKGHETIKSLGNLKQGKMCRVCANVNLSETKSSPLSHWEGILAHSPNYTNDMSITSKLEGRFLNFHCNKCAEDMYSKEGIGSGDFKIRNYCLSKGQIPCRCSFKPLYTEEQTLFRLKLELNKINKKFEGIVGDFIGNKTKFKVSCAKGTCDELSIVNFNNRGYRCKCCGERKEGFDYKNKACLYIYEIQHKLKLGCKVGITDNITKRESSHRGVNKLCDYKLLNKWEFSIGRDAFDIEQEVKDKFDNKFFSKKEMPSGYTESYDIKDLPEILNHIREAYDSYVRRL